MCDNRLFINRDLIAIEGLDSIMAHVCDLCGEKFDSSQLDAQQKMVLDSEGKWKVETTYRCFDCAKMAVLGRA